ncbi:MAG: Re/Si-specific NAD(P)(+) transhydrogenase subunit alpha [Xanthomonadales bacterium]|nr:Re/Si-specific NAD(P)(+) transhydrogenase subunit alpha [Xanthomonadales bacterium]NIN58424.1 Re/Si-specific NAD(P)(+) transhydrogenase subunit alpha [Xanthomonadales bacterium]NIN73761.1 Re/Si-specific NAD(P)(+) transhydrogenase subunit alpha [Xanthomonadales bacterium]NIO13731.1 Re/Si-specific NAD(P)(+) transhydrogenase subunit alpha [Xanthomonadales bacterium]NIP10817.1 Re/Si-specific NAD(P)(+) transhydrogenase subunit alpha [Xanthomonadales bacterium]
MRIGVPRETYAGEKRVATTPEVAAQLIKLGYEVVIESQAGAAAKFSDEAYRAGGCSVAGADEAWAADIVLKVRAPDAQEAAGLRSGQTLISFLWPAQNPELLQQLTASGVTALAMDSVPRISRAQKVDALSSMANIAGYRAVVEAAAHFGRFFTGQITAAGKVEPAKVLIIGAGVAGLAAIGAARSMGAIVRAFDTRPEVKEQVESMDAEFLMLDFEDEDGSGEGGYAKVMSDAFIAAEMALFAEQAREVDIIITTALIPGKPAPRLITRAMVESMQDGSVIVDLAAEQGGNCELTEPDRVLEHAGVTLIGYTDMPSRLPATSSQLYATNLRHLLSDMTPGKDGQLAVDMDDEVIRGATVCKDGATTWPPPAPKVSMAPPKPAEAAPPPVAEPKKKSVAGPLIGMALAGLALLLMGAVAPPSFMQHFTVFVLACFVGYMVIWNVTPALHTPLMSVTNAISSIIIIGALLQISSDVALIKWIAVATVAVTAVNIFGGFAVTRRMLEMFRK